jgi:hypothetical protein
MSTSEITLPINVEALTLDAAKSMHSSLAEIIAKLEADLPITLTLPAATIELAKGERFAGLVLSEDGKPSHHLVLLPGQATDVDWDDAKTWAASIGGELPTRQEQALLFANLKGSFETRAYWSGTPPSSGHAWCQYFSSGGQDNYSTSAELCARAVRRLPI